ncbi:MAG: hypothetical protein GY716_17155 [bacterium]|nr:hypothetical protein [bacterium]
MCRTLISFAIVLLASAHATASAKTVRVDRCIERGCKTGRFQSVTVLAEQFVVEIDADGCPGRAFYCPNAYRAFTLEDGTELRVEGYSAGKKSDKRFTVHVPRASKTLYVRGINKSDRIVSLDLRPYYEGWNDAAPTPSAPVAAAGSTDADSAALGDLGWMTGFWRSERDGNVAEEYWTDAAGGVMLGLHRDVRGSGKAFFEYLRIEQTDEGVVYLASPRGAAPTPFRLVENGPGRAVFANPEHDWPTSITYRLEGETTLCSTAAGPGREAEWCWERVEPR